jgi:hypothetical protein
MLPLTVCFVLDSLLYSGANFGFFRVNSRAVSVNSQILQIRKKSFFTGMDANNAKNSLSWAFFTKNLLCLL